MDKNYIIAVVSIIAGILYPTLIGWNNHQNNKREEADKVKALISRFQFAKELNLRVKTQIATYAKSNNVFDSEFMQGLSFRRGIKLLQECDEKLLSDDNYDSLKQLKRMPKNYHDLLNGIENHIKSVCEVQTALKFYFDTEQDFID